MMEHTDVHDTDEPTVYLSIELRLPIAQVETFRDALTGNDDDVLLAAETAMRELIGRTFHQELELAWAEARSIDSFLDEEVQINHRREALYGPVVDS